MSIINPEIVGFARVYLNIVPDGRNPPIITYGYEYSDGFETGTPTGATVGAGPIFFIPAPGSGRFVLFLNEPVDAGTVATEGGIKARADLVSVSTLSDPSPVFTQPATLRVQYSDYGLNGTPYQNVDQKKAVVVEMTIGILGPDTYNIKFDVVVFRDPVVAYSGVKIST